MNYNNVNELIEYLPPQHKLSHYVKVDNNAFPIFNSNSNGSDQKQRVVTLSDGRSSSFQVSP